MKYAGGCFGCLTLILFGLSIALTVGASAIATALVEVDPTLAATSASLIATAQYATSGCCCLSALAAVILLAVGMSGGNKAEEAT